VEQRLTLVTVGVVGLARGACLYEALGWNSGLALVALVQAGAAADQCD
jgi:hypothetical protein